jgi:glycosyltransferase involved in cell wall biosynthesis
LNGQTISIVIPSYNYADYLPQAVRSAALQTYADLELVIVDDASADGSQQLIRALADEYGGRFSSIQTIFFQKNRGAHAAINAGVRGAEGDCIAILNADDLYEPERLSRMAAALGGARLAFSRVACIGADGAPARTEDAARFEALPQRSREARVAALAALGEIIAVSTGNLLFEKSLFTELGGFRNYRYVHDYDFFLRACLITEPVFVEDTAYLYRLHGGNSFTRLRKRGLIENRLVWLDLYGMVNRGRVSNPAILDNPAWRDAFGAAAAQMGEKKRALWRLSKNPLIWALTAAGKKLYGV